MDRGAALTYKGSESSVIVAPTVLVATMWFGAVSDIKPKGRHFRECRRFVPEISRGRGRLGQMFA